MMGILGTTSFFGSEFEFPTIFLRERKVSKYSVPGLSAVSSHM